MKIKKLSQKEKFIAMAKEVECESKGSAEKIKKVSGAKPIATRDLKKKKKR